jgi:signal transduction histidine kinase
VVNGHAGRLTEVFTNLIDNAIKYTPLERQPRVQISGRAEDGMVTCVISDNGVGIAATDRERIFELLERVRGAGDTPPGSGVGLAVAARVVERTGGRIWVEDGLDGGSSFRLTIPMP